MKNYEYKTLYTTSTKIISVREELTNRLEEDINNMVISGWEFVSSMPIQRTSSSSEIITIFRPEKTELK